MGVSYQKAKTSALGMRISLSDTNKAEEDAAEEEEGNGLV